VKVAYLGPTGVFGGVRAIVEHLNGLAARGHACTLISNSGSPVTWLPCNFEQRAQSDPGTGYDVLVGTAMTTWPDVVKLGAARTFGLAQMADWAFFAKDSPEYLSTLDAFTTTPVEVLAISEWLAQLAEAAGHVTHRIRNGIDPKLFHPDTFPDVPPFDGITVVTEGYSHNRAKDTENYFHRAVRRLRWDEGYKIRAIGFSQFQASFEFDAYWANPAQELLRKIYGSGDIFLKASKLEGRPGPDLEAMACGAVVCRAIGAGGDDLLHMENCLVTGYGIEEREYEDEKPYTVDHFDYFLTNFRWLCDDADLRARLRANAFTYVREHADWPGAIDLVEQALTGTVTVPVVAAPDYAYDLATYNEMQRMIVHWETPQAMWLGETLAELLAPSSVIDIGCGPGTYLIPFKPDARVLGVDGAPEAGQAREPGEFVTADFRQDWRPVFVDEDAGPVGPDHFDLALCIETAEHLPPDRADYLVGLLAGSADAVFFSAAHPGQGGTLHLNEQPKEYWLDKFRARGWELHPKHEWLSKQIAANPHCQRVQWLIPNALLLGKVNGHDAH